MAVVVSLGDLVGEMQLVSSESHAYLNQVSGEIITIFDEYIAAVERDEDWSDRHDWEQVIFNQTKEVLSSDDYLELPSQFELHEYDIMESFCLSIPDEKLSDILLDQIRGSGAFRRFKNAIYRFKIEKDWFRFLEGAYKEIAIDWLESHELAYADDMNRGVQSS
jgi:hypothetical protein